MQTVPNIDRRTDGTTAFGAPVSAPGPHERRGTARAMSAWASLRGNNAIPALTDLLGRHRAIAAQEFLLKTDPIPRLSVFIYCGEALRNVLGRPVLGATFWDCIPRAARDTLSEACAAAMAQGAMVDRAGAFEAEAGLEIRYRGIFMPLRSPPLCSPALCSPALRSPALCSPGDDDPGYLFGAYGSRVFEATTPATA